MYMNHFFFFTKLLHISIYSLPREVMSKPSWTLSWCKVMGGGSVSYLCKRLALGVSPPFSHC